MNKTRIFTLTALCLIIIGGGLSVWGYKNGGSVYTGLTCNGDGCNMSLFRQYSSYEFESFTEEFTGDIKEVRVSTAMLDFTVQLADETKVVAEDVIKDTLKVSVDKGVLTIKTKYEFNINGSNQHYSPEVTLYITEQDLSLMKIAHSMGALRMTDIAAETLDISNSMGSIDIINTVGKTLTVKNSMGEIVMTDAVGDTMTVTNSMGNIVMTDAVSDTMTVTNSMGEVTLEQIMTPKLHVENSMGDINVRAPMIQSLTIHNSMADVDIHLTNDGKDYGYHLHTGGKITVNDQSNDNLDNTVKNNEKAPYFIRCDNSMGNINLQVE